MARAERCCSAVKGSDNKTPTILVKPLSQRGWSYTCGFLGGAEESEEEPALECRGWHRSLMETCLLVMLRGSGSALSARSLCFVSLPWPFSVQFDPSNAPFLILRCSFELSLAAARAQADLVSFLACRQPPLGPGFKSCIQRAARAPQLRCLWLLSLPAKAVLLLSCQEQAFGAM